MVARYERMAYSFTKHLVVALLLVTCLHVLAACELVDTAKAERHERWMVKHGRVYADDAEKARRLEVYKANVAFIESVNAGNHKFWLGENQFADLTNAEFMAMTTGFQPSRANRAPTAFRYASINADDLPASIDWRTKGAVTPVKNQGDCRCCWAFSSVASMEGIVKLRTGRLISLSEQELVDCAVNGGDHGCEGGLMDYAFEFIIKNGGLTTESNYPYTAKEDKCTIRSNSAATIKAYVNVPANDEAALQKAVANQPVSIALDGTDQHFQFYKGGILSGGCGTDLNHAVTAVGYGVSSDGTKYWLMKNSWGTSWGEDGYIRMERAVADKEGVCGLAMMASYPIA